MKDLTVLCKVVDNFGDAGVVLRMARTMCALDTTLHLRIITDNRKLFDMLQSGDTSGGGGSESAGTLASGSHSASAYSFLCQNRICFYDWDDGDGICSREFDSNPPRVILECFACGRPDWLEQLLFDDGAVGARASASAQASASDEDLARDGASANVRTTHIINVEFLTAENYADEFHLMKSGTRSSRVKKSIFMPGFTARTGGLILDGIFAEAEETKTLPKHNLQLRKKVFQNIFRVNDEASHVFNILVFTYDRKIVPLVSAFSCFKNFLSGQAVQLDKNILLDLDVHVARGAGFTPFVDAWKIVDEPFAVSELPFLPQTEWDDMLCCCDFLFVRGEDSLSRACLSGVPFVWQAYVQEDDYHLVKVNALLERMNPHFSEEDFTLVSAVWQEFNVSADTPASRVVVPCESIPASKVVSVSEHTKSDLIFEMLKKSAERESSLVKSFESFAKSLYENGNAAKHLLTYIKTFC